ncbi:MAG: plasmid stabilization protein [Desulfobulbaceae bacterium A2]|nr:MAG: plasmid stabilization protein [Desulfobulbaceae bacterium A2]
MQLVFSPLAERDLEAIGDYIARDNPRRALRFIVGLRAQCVQLAATPQAYRQCPELGDGIRSCAYGNYVIFFLVEGVAVRIIRVLHGAMDIAGRFSSEQ